MKRVGWGIVVVSLFFLGVIMPGFVDGFSAGSTKTGVVGWVLIAMFLGMFISGTWLALAKEDR